MTVYIPRAIYDAMLQHCIDGMPNEACGFLGGRAGRVEKIYRLTNEAASPVYYRPAGREMLAAMNDMDDAGLDITGIFHSHVASPPFPSPTDVREAHYPGTAYVIVSLTQRERPETKAYLIEKADWRDDKGEIVPVELVIS